jgi:hypothetical protein
MLQQSNDFGFDPQFNNGSTGIPNASATVGTLDLAALGMVNMLELTQSQEADKIMRVLS